MITSGWMIVAASGLMIGCSATLLMLARRRTAELTRLNASLKAEIEGRARAEESLRSECEVFQAVMDGAKNMHLVYLDRNFNFVRVNEAYATTCGYRTEEMIGKNHFTLYPHERNEAIFAHVRDTGEPFEIRDKPFEFPDQPERGVTYWDWSLTPVIEPDGMVSGLIFSLRETTERKKAELLLARELDAMSRLRQLGMLHFQQGQLEPVLSEILDTAIAIAGADFGNIQLFDPISGDLRIVAHKGLPQWWLDFWDSVAHGQGCCGTALERKERVIVEDVEQSPIFVDTPALAIQLRAGVRAVQSTPLISRSGTPVGMFSTHYKNPHHPEERLLRVLDLLARQAADLIVHSQTEDTLVAVHQQTQCIINNTPALVYALDLEERFVMVNAAIAQLLNAPQEQLIGRRRNELMSGEDADRHEANDRKVIEEGRSLEFEEYSQLNGRSITWLTTKFPLRDAHGRIHGVAGISSDITMRKQAEETLERQGQELQALNTSLNEGRLAALNLLEDAVAASKAAEKASRELQLARDALETKVAERTEELATLIKSLQEEIHERHRAEEALRAETAEKLQTLEALREKDRLLLQQSRLAAMGEMINNIAHQWRQPLNLLGMHIQKLLLFYDLGDFDRQTLATGTEEAMALVNHMSCTIDDFRTFFRPAREKAPFGVCHAVEKTLSLIQEGLAAEGIGIELRMAGESTIVGYENEFSQALMNILLNARDALMERRISPGLIILTLTVEWPLTIFTITDNAGGIPDGVIDKIFEPYFSTKGVQGTGIGLYMTKQIIETNMGGKLSARNSASGAEFIMEFSHA